MSHLPAFSRAQCWRLCVPLLLAALASGCAVTPPHSPSPAFDAMSTHGTLKRRLAFSPYDETQPSRQLIGLIDVGDSRLRAVLITPFGQRLVTLMHDSEGSRFIAGDLPQAALEEALPVSPEWLASRLEWSLWPTESLREAFAGSPWSATVDADSRIIRYRDRVVARITPATASATTPGEVLLDDRQGRYRLRIVPLDTPAQQEPRHE